MKKTLFFILIILFGAGAAFLDGCSKKSSDNGNGSSGSGSAAALSIQTGATTIAPGGTLTYNAVLVDGSGNTSAAPNVTWSVSTGGGDGIGSFSGNIFTGSGSGYGTVTASATVNGKTLTATVPVGVYVPALFSVVPSAVIWTTGAGTIPLTPVYIGTASVSDYTYASSNSSVATVDGSGVISFAGTGSCVITVTGNGLSGNNKVSVPVLVVGMPTVSLPVVRVAVTPGGADMFRGDNATFTAKAYNSSGNEVTGVAFTWASQDASVASVDASGKVTAQKLGKTVITAMGSGIVGQAEVQVLPDTAIIVTPFMASIPANGSKQFTATAYAVNHSTRAVTAISMPAGLTWSVPYTGISMFDIATVNASGLVTLKSSATTPFISTIVMASVSSPTIDPGVGLVMVSDCNCGTTTAGVTHIGVSTSTVALNLTSNPTATISAQALNASNSPVPGATLTYCTDNMSVCSVDSSGTLIAGMPGTATITICNGNVTATVTVTVTM